MQVEKVSFRKGSLIPIFPLKILNDDSTWASYFQPKQCSILNHSKLPSICIVWFPTWQVAIVMLICCAWTPFQCFKVLERLPLRSQNMMNNSSTLQPINISHLGKFGKSSTQNAIFGGYVSSQEGIPPGKDRWRSPLPCTTPRPSVESSHHKLALTASKLNLQHFLLHPGKRTWQWNTKHFESMYLLWKMVIFQPVMLVFGGGVLILPSFYVMLVDSFYWLLDRTNQAQHRGKTPPTNLPV